MSEKILLTLDEIAKIYFDTERGFYSGKTAEFTEVTVSQAQARKILECLQKIYTIPRLEHFIGQLEAELIERR